MGKPSPKKLVVKKETLRTLQLEQLKHVVGGAGSRVITMTN